MRAQARQGRQIRANHRLLTRALDASRKLMRSSAGLTWLVKNTMLIRPCGMWAVAMLAMRCTSAPAGQVLERLGGVPTTADSVAHPRCQAAACRRPGQQRHRRQRAQHQQRLDDRQGDARLERFQV